MAIFDRLDRMMSKAVDRTFAIVFECHPLSATPNGRPGADPAREAWTGKGVLEEQPAYHAVETGKRDRTSNDLRTLATGSVCELSVDRVRYPGADTTKQGDWILFDDMRKFAVLTAERDGLARVVFKLSRL